MAINVRRRQLRRTEKGKDESALVIYPDDCPVSVPGLQTIPTQADDVYSSVEELKLAFPEDADIQNMSDGM